MEQINTADATWYQWSYKVQDRDEPYVVRTQIPTMVIGTPAEAQVDEMVRQMLRTNPPGKAWYRIEKRPMTSDEIAAMDGVQ